ncbi:hypothetical protein W03_06880 [Nitrosomonas sp. PY1]|uniref:hypothetical protein n=1 Tax=Nitrosomonas sp. PY1 TaxID=1803906 RepID=UPI001FC89C83|nr:hypothetical protein [Nitrosomonas sp. PY1]GKS68684.1 hypothetical protein W03_06880 [Nitrosomonas sp. PY1]
MAYYTKIDTSKPVGKRCSVWEDVNILRIVVEGYFPYGSGHYFMEYNPNHTDYTRRALVYNAVQNGTVGPDGSAIWVKVGDPIVFCRP